MSGRDRAAIEHDILEDVDDPEPDWEEVHATALRLLQQDRAREAALSVAEAVRPLVIAAIAGSEAFGLDAADVANAAPTLLASAFLRVVTALHDQGHEVEALDLRIAATQAFRRVFTSGDARFLDDLAHHHADWPKWETVLDRLDADKEARSKGGRSAAQWQSDMSEAAWKPWLERYEGMRRNGMNKRDARRRVAGEMVRCEFTCPTSGQFPSTSTLSRHFKPIDMVVDG